MLVKFCDKNDIVILMFHWRSPDLRDCLKFDIIEEIFTMNIEMFKRKCWYCYASCSEWTPINDGSIVF